MYTHVYRDLKFIISVFCMIIIIVTVVSTPVSMIVDVRVCLLIAYAHDMGQAHAMGDPGDPWARDPGLRPGPCLRRALVLGSWDDGSHMAWSWLMSRA